MCCGMERNQEELVGLKKMELVELIEQFCYSVYVLLHIRDEVSARGQPSRFYVTTTNCDKGLERRQHLPYWFSGHNCCR